MVLVGKLSKVESKFHYSRTEVICAIIATPLLRYVALYPVSENMPAGQMYVDHINSKWYNDNFI
jgi:hypothetical protein